PSRTVWAWGWRSAAGLSRRTAAGCGPRPTPAQGRRFSLHCPRVGSRCPEQGLGKAPKRAKGGRKGARGDHSGLQPQELLLERQTTVHDVGGRGRVSLHVDTLTLQAG